MVEAEALLYNTPILRHPSTLWPAHSNKATPTPMSPIPTERSKGGGDDQRKPTVRGTENDKPVQKGDNSDHDEIGVTKSPPIYVSKGTTTRITDMSSDT